MRTVVIEGPERVHVAASAKPSAGEAEVVIRVAASGICGTDVHIFKGDYLGEYPVIPGHEFAGEVVELGPGVSEFKLGDRVAVEPNLSCGHCRFCQLHQENFCENWQAIGVGLPGGMAEYVAAPVSAVFDIGDLPFETAAFMEPLSCVLHGMEKVKVRRGESIVIIGAGPIGLLLAQVAREQGAERIVMADRIASRLNLARQIVADEAVNTRDSWEPIRQMMPDGYDVAIDATGVPEVIERTIDLVRRGGGVLWFGVAPIEGIVRVKPFDVFRNGLSIYSSFCSLRNSRQALELLSSGAVKADQLVSHRLPLEAFERGIKLLDHPEGAMKIQLIPSLTPEKDEAGHEKD